ncbi:DUF2332 domain-containing protein [Aquipuribacter sp. MA13-6]|uniref:DUF2332 domain-containing protein n=1 Tax=unclassified Aquipuribacter TaxID=2635084 RepID=UPI003EEB0988
MDDGAAPLVRHLHDQAQACADMGSPMYADLLRACAADLREAGDQDVLRVVLADHLHAPGPAATGIRLLGAVHHLVLTSRAPGLAAHYPSVGGTPGPGLWRAFREALADHPDEVAAFLQGPPQTNEVGRSAALVGGLIRVLAGRDLPVRLHEIGSSAGLNLNADRYRVQAGPGGPWWGPAGSPVQLVDAWRGAVPDVGAPLHVVERVGTDVAPVDLGRPGAAERLLAYVWADQGPRVQRTRAALEVAAAHPVGVERLDAVAAVDRLDLRPGHLTVLWHSVMWQYLTREDQARVGEVLARLGATATSDAPLVELSLEPERPRPGAHHEFLVAARTWPGGERVVLGTSVGHGVPTRWHPGPVPTLGR